ncbi:MAG: hypothetical protein OXH15_19210 [Gammaproteobacteria bacterium]|nr:hypothetical protein [Gammaproteobacteria bacterium]
MERTALDRFAHDSLTEDLIRVLLAKRYPRAWLNRLNFKSMVRVPDAWVAARWRCANVVSGIPLAPDGPEPQPTHTVVAVKFAAVVAPEVHERLGRHVALLEGEFDRRRAFGAPSHPPLVTAVVVVEGRSVPKGPRAASATRRVVRWRPGAVRFVR